MSEDIFNLANSILTCGFTDYGNICTLMIRKQQTIRQFMHVCLPRCARALGAPAVGNSKFGRACQDRLGLVYRSQGAPLTITLWLIKIKAILFIQLTKLYIIYQIGHTWVHSRYSRCSRYSRYSVNIVSKFGSGLLDFNTRFCCKQRDQNLLWNLKRFPSY